MAKNIEDRMGTENPEGRLADRVPRYVIVDEYRKIFTGGKAKSRYGTKECEIFLNGLKKIQDKYELTADEVKKYIETARKRK